MMTNKATIEALKELIKEERRSLAESKRNSDVARKVLKKAQAIHDLCSNLDASITTDIRNAIQDDLFNLLSASYEIIVKLEKMIGD